MSVARSLIGTREVPGPMSNKTIIDWANKVGAKILGIKYESDGIPWCGLFCAYVLHAHGIIAPVIAVRAKAWADWGANLGADRLAPGAILVFDRDGGGHVAFYVGEDATHYHVLGGNQGDAVSIMRLAKGRCIARRWPRGVPVIGGPVRLSSTGAPVSRNEA